MKRPSHGRVARRRAVIAAVVAVCVLATTGCDGVSPETGKAAEKAAGDLVEHGAGVLFGSLPKFKTAGQIQEDTLRANIKGAACDWLHEYITSGEEPPSADFFNSLGRRLSTFGSPAQNELNAIQGQFTTFSNTVNGKTDASDAAKRLACSFLPG
jgi:hypothetical protein